MSSRAWGREVLARPTGFARLTGLIMLAALLLLMGVLHGAQSWGLPDVWVTALLMGGTLAGFAWLGLQGRTTGLSDYLVAGRRVAALPNGMATAADWISAASFMGLMGSLWVQGFGGLAYVVGWTGGFCLLAFWLAPALRRSGQFSVAGFLAARYGSSGVRGIAALATIACAFAYVVAQIAGVGVVTAYLTGLDYTFGTYLGLGGVLLCSFLGGMRGITRTQLAQYVVLLLALLMPAAWLAEKQVGSFTALWSYGEVLEQVTLAEQRLLQDEAELLSRQLYGERAQALEASVQRLPQSLYEQRQALEANLVAARAQAQALDAISKAEAALEQLPTTPELAREVWTQQAKEARLRAAPLAGLAPHAQPFPALDSALAPWHPQGQLPGFLALVFCLALGTAGMPHLLMRSCTTPDVPQARRSVVWALLFIGGFYVLLCALVVLMKWEVFHGVVGLRWADLPAWLQGPATGPGRALAAVEDINGDGRLQWAELSLAPEQLMLALPEMAGLPHVITALVATGAVAAALSTADGLLLTLSTALTHDLYFKWVRPQAGALSRVLAAKVVLLCAALVAAWVASRQPASIVPLVAAVFSFTASTFVPPLLLGLLWPRANAWGALAGMLVGAAVVLSALACGLPGWREALGWPGELWLWGGLSPLASGVFGVPANGLAMWLVSMLTARPGERSMRHLAKLRSLEPAAKESVTQATESASGSAL
jgi:cation/acetate symporter